MINISYYDVLHKPVTTDNAEGEGEGGGMKKLGRIKN